MAAPFFGHEPHLGKLRHNAVGVRFGFIDFVYRNDNRNAGVFRVVYRFDRLRHHAVVGGDNQHDNVGNLRSARPHHRKGFVTGRIQKGNTSLRRFDHICADVLGNAAEFGRNNVRTADCVEGFCLSVVDVSHNRNNRRPGSHIGFAVFFGCDNRFFIQTDDFYVAVVFGSKQGRRIRIDGLRNRHHHSHRHQFGDNFRRF